MEQASGGHPRKIGILGAGYISEFHIGALRSISGVTVAAVCDADPNKAETIRRKWAIPRAFDSLDKMLEAGGLDAVHILLPPPLHAAAGQQCLEGGCDVFLEKPMAVRSDEVRALSDAARRTGRIIGVNHNNVCHPAFLRLLEATREWRLGGLQHVTASLNVPLRQLDAGQHGHWMFQKPENILLEQACHPLSQICRLLGPVKEASALISGETTLNTGAIFYDTWQCSLLCERGSAQLFLSFGREHHDAWLHVIGQDAAAFVDLRRNTFRISRKTRFLEPVDDLIDALRNGASVTRQGLGNLADYTLGFLKLRPPNDAFSSSMRMSIARFHEDLRVGRPPSEGGQAGAVVIAACEAIAACASRTPEALAAGMKHS